MSEADQPRGEKQGDMAERLLLRWTALLGARRAALIGVLALLGLLFSWMGRGVRWQPDVLQFFSATSADVRDFREAGGSANLATQMRLDVHGDEKNVQAAAADLADRLQASGQFQAVWAGLDVAAFAAAFVDLVQNAPAILNDRDIAEIQKRITPTYVNERFVDVRQHLADPDGEVLLRRLAADPLDVTGVIAGKLKSLSPGSQSEDGLATRDAAGQLHVMIVAQPKAAPSDQQASERLMADTRQILADVRAAHPGVEMWLVGAHRAYVENARRVKRDVGMVSLIGALAVATAIGLWFRQGGGRGRAGWREVLICMLPPSVGVGIALGIAGAMHVELPLILLGFAGLLCGSTTDYGIQIISECRRLIAERGGWEEELPARAARNMLGPISMSVATSVTGFAALGLSDAPGLRGLGLFVAGATVCIWVVTFLVLPVFLGRWVVDGDARARVAHPRRSRALTVAGALLFVGVTVWLGYWALRVEFDTNPRALDGSSAQLRAEEEAFYQVWGDMRSRGIVQVSGGDTATALERLADVHNYLRDQQRDGLIARVLSPAVILPDPRNEESHLKAWQNLWTSERREQLSSLLAVAASANRMRPESFVAYADRVAATKSTSPEDALTHSPAALIPGIIHRSDGRVTISSIIDMRRDCSLRMATAWGSELRLRFGDWPAGSLRVLSGNMLIFDAIERSRAQGEHLGPLCLIAILLPLWIYFRRLRRAWLAMLCLICGFIWVLGAAMLFGRGLNLLSLVPVLFTLGVAVDYGIYTASDPSRTRTGATFLCALTTILGSGALIVAAHPALRWLGITLVAGITGGYLTSLFIVAPLAAWRPRPRLVLSIGKRAFSVLLVVTTIAIALPVAAQWLMSRAVPAGLSANPATLAPLRQVEPRTYTAGRSWVRWREAGPDSGLWELFLAGDARERGYATAKLAGPIDLRIENEMLDQLDTFLPREAARFAIVQGISVNLLDLPRHIPEEYQQEIYWAAKYHDDPHEYLAPTYPRILAYHALHDISQMLIDNPLIVPNTFACTGVVSLPAYSAAEGGHLMLARVFDFEGGESFGRQKSITYVIPPEGQGIPFAHVAWPGLSGAVTGMNREKIALFINAAASSDFRRIGTPTILIARDILQHARTLDDAQRLIEQAQVFVSDVIVVADGKTGEARIFEKSPARFAATRVDRSAAVTNHCSSKTFAGDSVNQDRITSGTTMQRYTRACELLDRMEHRVTPESLATLLRDKNGAGNKDLGYGNRNAIDGLIACHAVIMDATAGQMWVAAWPYAEGKFLGVDVMSMLDGGAEKPAIVAPATPAEIPEDSMMRKVEGAASAWEAVQMSRSAARSATDALAAGDSTQALRNADEVVRNNPHFYLGHLLRAQALLKGGDRHAARAALEEALALDPPYASRRAAIQGLIRQCEER